MHQQQKRPNASVVVAELGESLCTHHQASQVVTSRSSPRAGEIFTMRGSVRCKKEHTSVRHRRYLQHSMVHPGTQHAWNAHNEHGTSMMLWWQADRVHHSTDSSTLRWSATMPLPGNLHRRPRRPYGANCLLRRFSSPSRKVRRAIVRAQDENVEAHDATGWCREARVGSNQRVTAVRSTSCTSLDV